MQLDTTPQTYPIKLINDLTHSQIYKPFQEQIISSWQLIFYMALYNPQVKYCLLIVMYFKMNIKYSNGCMLYFYFIQKKFTPE